MELSRRTPLLLGLTALAGCTFSAAVPFPTAMPSQRVLDAQYQTLRHDLSTLKQYQFEITVPAAWKTLDTAMVQEPAGDVPEEIAAFREPGDWMTDPDAPAKAEVSVSVLNLSGSLIGTGASLQWLTTILDRTIPGYRILEQRETKSAAGDSGDMLIRFNAPEDIIARFYVVLSKDKKHVIVITGSAPGPEYAARAEQLFVALQSFHLL
ncbi:hypothetical protein HZA87_03100 [Candidatus Uhrbacteria bacterium]|nr:hypothetical protein [Candidatus Uhrbacteria bacterium]